jgi:hypothetical protein
LAEEVGDGLANAFHVFIAFRHLGVDARFLPFFEVFFNVLEVEIPDRGEGENASFFEGPAVQRFRAAAERHD